MSARTLLAIAAIALLSPPGRAQDVERVEADLNADTLSAVLADFFASAAGESGSPGAQGGGGRRLRQFQGFDEFLRDFDLSLSLSDFLDGLLQNPGLDFLAGPLTQEGVEALLREKYEKYCADPEKADGEEAHKACEGPVLTLELVPASCEVLDSASNKLECEPAKLVYTRAPGLCRSEHQSGASFTGKECRITKALGPDKEIVLGGGAADLTLTLGAQDVKFSPPDLRDIADLAAGIFS